MDANVLNSLQKLKQNVLEASKKINLEKDSKKLVDLRQKSVSPDFWEDNLKAQKIMQDISKLEEKVLPWQSLIAELSDAIELAELNDDSLTNDLSNSLRDFEARYDSLKDALKLSGPYDDHDAILYIYSGAGGTDAQDWAQMMLRMYTRFLERQGFKFNLVDEVYGEEAGIKSAALEIHGAYAYGKFKGEHGVHRLVRLSPFNADNLRQTSFAKVDVLPLIDEPDEVEVDEADLRVDVFRSGGHGGQSVNTTDSAVRITHIPTGISVVIQNERSQLQNRRTAMTILRSRLAQMSLEQQRNKIEELKGPVTSAEWGNQIRSYVLHPYKLVKDLRTGHEDSDPDKVLDGELQGFIDSFLEHNIS